MCKISADVILSQIGLKPGDCPKCLGTGARAVPEELWEQEGCSMRRCPDCGGRGKRKVLPR